MVVCWCRVPALGIQVEKKFLFVLIFYQIKIPSNIPTANKLQHCCELTLAGAWKERKAFAKRPQKHQRQALKWPEMIGMISTSASQTTADCTAWVRSVQTIPPKNLPNYCHCNEFTCEFHIQFTRCYCKVLLLTHRRMNPRDWPTWVNISSWISLKHCCDEPFSIKIIIIIVDVVVIRAN